MSQLHGAKPSLKDLVARRMPQETPVTEGRLNPGSDLPWVIEGRHPLDLIGWASKNREHILAKLSQHGAVLFRGFSNLNANRFEEFIQAVSAPAIEYRERSSPRGAVAGKIYTSTDYPPAYEILPHNENSYAHTWPLKIFFYCETPPVSGGETPLVDVRRVYQRISPETRAKFEQLGILYARNFHEALGVSWRDTFQTSDPEAVERYCRASGYEIEWTAFGLRTRRVAPAVRTHPLTGEKLWFNHAAFFHVSSLHQDIRPALLAQFGEHDAPNHTYYGDGSPIEAGRVAEIHDAYRRETVRFSWQRGDVLMVDNMRTAHARSAYQGPRRILVGMSEPFDGR